MNANRKLKRKYRLLRIAQGIALELRKQRINPDAVVLLSNLGHGYLADRTGTLIQRYIWVIEELRKVKYD
jgi:hypothetical protein